MKKFALILGCLFGSLCFAAAQESVTIVYPSQQTATAAYNWQNRPSSLTFAIGAPSMCSMIEAEVYTDNGLTDSNAFSGSASVRYDYNVLRWMAVGGRVSYDGWMREGNLNGDNVRYTGQQSSILMEILFTYINREHVQLYSGLALGMQYFMHNGPDLNKRGMNVAGSIIPIGVHVGGQKVYALAEVSLGTEALMSFGIGFHF